MRNGKFWLTIFLICVGVVVGSMMAEITAGVPYLGWLSYGLTFGTDSPLVLNLNILRLTFGINVKLTVSTLIFVALSLILGRLIDKK